MIKLGPLDINYESMTFPSLITPTAGLGPGDRPWEANSAHSRENPGPRASAFINSSSCGCFCSRKVLSL